MSFRSNRSQNLSQHTFIMEGNQLVAASIGLTANGTALSCRLNVDQHDYRYCKTQSEILEAVLVVDRKLKQWAFRELQKSTSYHRQYSKAVFLPEALSHGNYGAMTTFLGNLRSNRVNSFIKLNLEESSGSFHKSMALTKLTSALFKSKKELAFAQLKHHMIANDRRLIKNKILIDIDRISSIENRLSEYSEPERIPKTKTINVTFIPIRINPENIGQLSHRKSTRAFCENSAERKGSQSRQEVASYIDIRDLIEESKIREYEFKHITAVRGSGPRGSMERGSSGSRGSGDKVNYERNM